MTELPSTDSRAMQLFIDFDEFGIPSRVGVRTFKVAWHDESEVESISTHTRVEPTEEVLAWLCAVAYEHKPPRLL